MQVSHQNDHMGRGSRLYNIWRGMRQRCRNPKASWYSIYGGSGISITSDWENYSDFREWALNNGYNDTLTIERRYNNKNYEPNNCYWADTTTQACNKRKRKGRASEFIGVAPNRKKWQAYISYKGKRTELGTYKTPEEAAQVRDAYVKSNNLPHKLNF